MADPDPLPTDFARLYLRLHRVMDRAMAEQGASLAKSKLLLFVARQGSARAADIADVFGHAPRTVTEAIDNLERDGLVRRDPDPDDRRVKRVSVTPAGHDAVAATEPLRIALVARTFGTLDPAERAQFGAILAKLSDAVAACEAQHGLGETPACVPA